MRARARACVCVCVCVCNNNKTKHSNQTCHTFKYVHTPIPFPHPFHTQIGSQSDRKRRVNAVSQKIETMALKILELLAKPEMAIAKVPVTEMNMV